MEPGPAGGELAFPARAGLASSPVFTAGLWLNPGVASPPFDHALCVREVSTDGKSSGCVGHGTTSCESPAGIPALGFAFFPMVFTQLTALLLALPLVPRLCVCWGLL